MSWLQELILQHREFESPQSFIYWSGLCTISAVVQDKVWINRIDYYNTYPNIYVILHADSGLRKSAPIAMAKRLVRKIECVKLVTGRSSIQGIMRKMGTSYSLPGGKVMNKSAVFIASSELSSSLVSDPAVTNILTDFYDRNYNEDDWDSLLKSEQYSIKDPMATLLGATNEAHADELFAKKEIEGGFLARTFIVYDNKPNTINSLMYKTEYPVDYEKLIPYLKEISMLEGEFVLPEPVKRYYDEWYHDLMRGIFSSEIKDTTGSLNRLGDSVLKVAMLLSLAKQPDLVISLQTLEEAIKECEKLTGNVRRTTVGKGRSQWAQHKGELIRELMRREPHSMTRKMINKKWGMHANSSEWDEIIKSLEAAGVIQLQQHSSEMMIIMSDEQFAEYKKYFEGKN